MFFLNIRLWIKGAVSIRPVFGPKPISFLILLNDPAYIGFMYAHYLLEWSNRIQIKWAGLLLPNPTPTPTGDKQMHIQLYSYYIIL